MSDGKTLYKQMRKIQEMRTRYYVNAEGVTMLFWAGGWMPWDYVAARDKRYVLS